jgi:hypothetical protein
VDRPAQLEEDVKKLCDASVARYRAAWTAELARRPASARKKDPMPPDASPAFVRATHGRTALHVLQHADITRAAARQVWKGKLPAVFEMVAAGAQEPDLNNKEDSRFHAQYHRATVVGHLTSLFGTFADNVHRGNMANAAVILGVVCHVIQDAAFYKGMSVEELAGLTYVAGQDPYGPDGVKYATKLTKYLLEQLPDAVSDDAAWKRFLAWVPTGDDIDMPAIHRGILGREAPLDHGALTRQWLQGQNYKRFPERQKALANGAPGLAKWDPDLFVAEALGPGGVAQPGGGPGGGERAARRVALPSRPR